MELELVFFFFFFLCFFFLSKKTVALFRSQNKTDFFLPLLFSNFVFVERFVSNQINLFHSNERVKARYSIIDAVTEFDLENMFLLLVQTEPFVNDWKFNMFFNSIRNYGSAVHRIRFQYNVNFSLLKSNEFDASTLSTGKHWIYSLTFGLERLFLVTFFTRFNYWKTSSNIDKLFNTFLVPSDPRCAFDQR